MIPAENSTGVQFNFVHSWWICLPDTCISLSEHQWPRTIQTTAGGSHHWPCSLDSVCYHNPVYLHHLLNELKCTLCGDLHKIQPFTKGAKSALHYAAEHFVLCRFFSCLLFYVYQGFKCAVTPLLDFTLWHTGTFYGILGHLTSCQDPFLSSPYHHVFSLFPMTPVWRSPLSFLADYVTLTRLFSGKLNVTLTLTHKHVG